MHHNKQRSVCERDEDTDSVAHSVSLQGTTIELTINYAVLAAIMITYNSKRTSSKDQAHTIKLLVLKQLESLRLQLL